LLFYKEAFPAYLMSHLDDERRQYRNFQSGGRNREFAVKFSRFKSLFHPH
jgi:hypothetical protein